MRRPAILAAVSLLATVPPLAASAEDFQALYERVGKQRHLSMIEKGIGTNDARTIAMLAYMTYGHRTCGDSTVTEADVEKVWTYLKVGPSLDDATRKSETAIFADELDKAVTGLPSFDKQGFCAETGKSVVSLKASWGLN